LTELRESCKLSSVAGITRLALLYRRIRPMPKTQVPLIDVRNLKAHRDGNKLVLEIDMDEAGTVSASGKSTVIASTGGNHKIEGGFTLSVNLYKRN